MAYAITENVQDAEDVLQETMIEISTYAGTYRNGSNAKAWVLAIARHLSIDVVRNRRSAYSLDDPDCGDIPETERGFSQVETLEMLKVLDDDERQLILFRLYTGLPYQKIAEMMGISVASAQKKYQRAIKKLRDNYL